MRKRGDSYNLKNRVVLSQDEARAMISCGVEVFFITKEPGDVPYLPDDPMVFLDMDWWIPLLDGDGDETQAG